jgi:hypothetical protein
MVLPGQKILCELGALDELCEKSTLKLEYLQCQDKGLTKTTKRTKGHKKTAQSYNSGNFKE